ncbi:MAG: hypothetical protein AUI47_04500 [Acidobacteria bacterium 13_1_40CM_2_68_5]|nr:MAG: hypothetical protein AUI47_04500 [Acidobacteria bacterium 13_1_40CM_2_68_5]
MFVGHLGAGLLLQTIERRLNLGGRFLVLILALVPGSSGVGFAGTFVVFGPKDYRTASGKPKTSTDTFSVLNPLETYTLLVYNGGLLQTFDRATLASVTLNGAQVVGGSECSSKVAVVPKTVTLAASNRLEVLVQGWKSSGVTIKIIGVDKDPPIIKPTLEPAPNEAGWNNTNVSVRFDCSDSTSGVATCTRPITVSHEGAGQVLSGTASDRTGTTSGASVKVSIDRTPPQIAASVDPPPNAAGWNRTDVTVRFSANDALSGIATVSDPVTVTTEGAGQETDGRAVDRAGNIAFAGARISIDRTAPTIRATVTPGPNANGWTSRDATVTFVCSDGESGIAFCPPPITVTSEGADQEFVGRAEDRAGNSASAGVKISLDKTPPVIRAAVSPGPNAGGWNRSDVSVTFSAEDAHSGVAEVTPPAAVTHEGGGQTVRGRATDRAGLSADVAVTVNLARTPPELSIASPASGSITGADQVTVLGSVTDAAPVTVLVNDVAAAVTGGRFMAARVPLALGLNSILVTAVDGAGNSSDAGVFVRREVSAPAVRVFAPPEVAAGGGLELSADAIGPQAIVSVTFYVDGELVATDTERPYMAGHRLRPERRPGDVLMVVARAVDAGGVESDDATIVKVVAGKGAGRASD